MLGYKPHKIRNELGKHRSTLKPDNMAPFVKQVLERFSQGDITKAELARYASSIGLRSKNGKVLSEDSIHRLIKNPVYAGYITGNLTNGQLVEGKHEALISQPTYETNQRLLYGRRKRKGEEHLKLNPDYPLKGLTLCVHCKNVLYASAPRTGAGGKSPRYHCSRSSCRGLVKSVKASQMHEDFVRMLKQIKPNEATLSLYRSVLVTEAANKLGGLNAKISRVRNELDAISSNRLSAIKNFNSGKLSEAEKIELVSAYEDEKEMQTEELQRLEKQQMIREKDIDLAVSIMRDVDTQWGVASLAARQRFQNMLFPDGLVYYPKTHQFGTNTLSPLYRCVPLEKGSEEPLKSYLVAGVGLEPTTSWL